jgi:hypothetical protein
VEHVSRVEVMRMQLENEKERERENYLENAAVCNWEDNIIININREPNSADSRYNQETGNTIMKFLFT